MVNKNLLDKPCRAVQWFVMIWNITDWRYKTAEEFRPAGPSPPKGIGRMAPTGLKTYPAWRTDPTRQYLDTPLDSDPVIRTYHVSRRAGWSFWG